MQIKFSLILFGFKNKHVSGLNHQLNNRDVIKLNIIATDQFE